MFKIVCTGIAWRCLMEAGEFIVIRKASPNNLIGCD